MEQRPRERNTKRPLLTGTRAWKQAQPERKVSCSTYQVWVRPALGRGGGRGSPEEEAEPTSAWHSCDYQAGEPLQDSSRPWGQVGAGTAGGLCILGGSSQGGARRMLQPRAYLLLVTPSASWTVLAVSLNSSSPSLQHWQPGSLSRIGPHGPGHRCPAQWLTRQSVFFPIMY